MALASHIGQLNMAAFATSTELDPCQSGNCVFLARMDAELGQFLAHC